MGSIRDFYEILGVAENADERAIKRRYRRLAMEFHPDRNPGSKDAGERFKEFSVAYAVLSDPEKRRRYDQTRRRPTTIDDIADDFSWVPSSEEAYVYVRQHEPIL